MDVHYIWQMNQNREKLVFVVAMTIPIFYPQVYNSQTVLSGINHGSTDQSDGLFAPLIFFLATKENDILCLLYFLVESSYFRRHCISHVLPNPLSKQIYFYKCYYCDDGFQTKHMFISHMLAHESDDRVCRECKEHFSSERALFCHMIAHGHTKCPACDEVFNENNSTGNCSQSSNI